MVSSEKFWGMNVKKFTDKLLERAVYFSSEIGSLAIESNS